MAGGDLTGAMLRRAFEAGAAGRRADGELLARFVEGGDRVALEVLIARHGPMVWGTCLRVLRDHHDAEDAFQVTFGVLARRAGAVAPREMVGPWLYGVAYRTAVKARMSRGRRLGREAPVARVPEPDPGRPAAEDAVDLDRALSRLPDKYRDPIVLCELEGLTHREAADQLGWPVGTVAGRLSRGRAILARALRRDESPRPDAPLVPLLAPASWPPSLAASTARSFGLAASPPASWAVPSWFRTRFDTERIARTMLFAPGKSLTRAALAATLAGLAATVAARPGPPTPPAPPAAGPPFARQAADVPPVAEVDPALARKVAGRVVRALPVEKDVMILAYLPDQNLGHVDNLAVANNNGGVRALVAWPKVAPGDLAPPERRFVLAMYSKQTTPNPRVGPILAFEVEQDWPESANWGTMPDYAAEPAATYPFDPADGWKLFDVTAIVRRPAEKDRPGPHGVLLRFLSEDRNRADGWSGYDLVSSEGAGPWKARRPLLLVVEPASK